MRVIQQTGFPGFCFSGWVPCFTTGFRAAARAYFLLLRQKKVAKEKATPWSTPRYAGFLALLGRPGGWPNSPLCGSDMASRKPPTRLRCSASSKGKGKALPNRRTAKKLNTTIAPRHQNFAPPPKSGWFFPPHARCRATQGLAEKGQACLRGVAPSLRRPRQDRVAQGSPAGATEPGSPSFCLLFLGEARKSKTRRSAEPIASTKNTDRKAFPLKRIPSTNNTPR